jgi:F0F1-type ATP synthase assembly protein I
MSDQPKKPDRKRQAINLTLAGVAAQVGCLTLVIVLGAVFTGLWLDRIFETRPWFTIGLVVVSIPISVIMMVVVARLAVSKIKTEGQKSTKQQ